jgi:hypothetical protein
MFNSKLFWGGILLCVAVFVGILLYRTNQPPQEPIKIYKIVVPERRATVQSVDKQKEQTKEDANETEDTSTSVDSRVSIDSEGLTPQDTQLSEAEVTTEESTPSDSTETENVSESKEERYYGLTLIEIEEKIPVLEEEIRTNLTKAVELYTELRSTDGVAGKSPELIAWRDETWQEVKRLFNDVAHTGKITRYTSYLKVTGVAENPLLPGGWIYELTEPLPMRVTPSGTSQ